MNRKIDIFVKHVKSECRKHGVKCRLRKTKYVKISNIIKVSGYFDDSVPELVCAMDAPNAIEILVHEFAHVTQWQDNIPLWKAADVSIPSMDTWLEGNEVVDIKKHLAVCRDLELDNEKRTVQIIKQFDLPIDVKTYTQKANAYVMFYNYMLITRKWSQPGNAPYRSKKILELMPTKFNMNYSKLPKKIEKIFMEEGI